MMQLPRRPLLSLGATTEEANDYGASGCFEIGRKGDFWCMLGSWVNLPMAIELSFTNGVRRLGLPGNLSGERVSVETEDPPSFNTFEEFKGCEDIRQMCLNVPKYGNADDYVDLLEQRSLAFYTKYCKEQTGYLAKMNLIRRLQKFGAGLVLLRRLSLRPELTQPKRS